MSAGAGPGLSSARMPSSTHLDPDDWRVVRAQGHAMLDDIFDHLQTLRDQPVWQSAPAGVRAALQEAVPRGPTDLGQVHQMFKDTILPYGSGNTHPGFMGWVQGGGTVAGMLAEMLAAGMNANLGGRDHMPIQVERQIADWARDIFDFPETAGGLFLTGASQANFVAVLLARTRYLGRSVRHDGLAADRRLVAYASSEVHGCVPRALDMAGIGSDQLRRIATLASGRIDPDALVACIERDIADGLAPFLVVGSAGTVNTGAVDDLATLSAIARGHGLHFHVDGALGALGVLSDDLKPLFTGIELCDSLAFDFHKWGQVPYDAGFLLVRDSAWQKETFASDNAYLTRAASGLAGGDWWPCDHGPDLSRGFRALKTWFTLKTYGVRKLGDSMAANCRLAQYLKERILAEPLLELLAPVALNIVCFGYRAAADSVAANDWIVEQLHLAGEVAPSLTLVDGRPAIRAAFVNHRTTTHDVDTLVNSVLDMGARKGLAE